jgi:hypothetical protein
LASVALALACTPIDRQPQGQRVATVQPVRVAADRGAMHGPVITVLQTRDHEVTVYGGDSGLRFTVTNADGDRLATQIAEDVLARSFPGLYRTLETAFAGDTAFAEESLELDASASRVPDEAPEHW